MCGSLQSSGGIHRRLIEYRNRQWVAKFRMIARRGQSALVIIGVEHLVDPTAALPEILEKAGFTVRTEPSPGS